MRNWTQDKLKYKTFNSLDPLEIYIHFDWAMKYMPLKYREKQQDFFGKRGINWHITCVVFKSSSEAELSCSFI